MKVELTQPHTHAGTAYAAGDLIEVTEPEAAWLAERSVIRPAKKSRSSQSVSETLPDEESAP